MNVRAERWQQVSALFDRAAELTPDERRRMLDAECRDDPELRSEVERLLRADEQTNPLDHDIAAQASALLLEGDPERHTGQLFGRYRIVRLLGQGGMGRVYLAQREGDDFVQTVALKLVGGFSSFDAALARRRFLEERRLLARLEHPNIARLLDGGVGPEAQPWFAMEYVDGAPLTQWCEARQLPLAARLDLFAKVCDAVDHAHRFLIVHRDLKPGNLLVDGRGEPKVLDFGIAKLLGDESQDTGASTIVMTPYYAAPEQLRGGQISTATDVYSLGAVLFELLAGRRAFPDPLASREPPLPSKAVTESRETLTARAAACATTPHALRKCLRGDLDRIVRTALDPDPARRYGSAATLAQDLRAVVAGQPISLRSDRAYRVGIFLRRHTLGVAAATTAVLALIATTGWALWQTQQAVNQAGIAEREAQASQSVSELLVSAFDAADPAARTSLAEPTAKDVLDASAAGVDEKLKDTPELRARMQMLLGQAYQNLGAYAKAAGLLEAAIAGFLSASVNRIDHAAEATSLLAQVEMDRERRARAVVLAGRAIELHKGSHATPEELIDASQALGLTLIGTQRYDDAERVLNSVQSQVAQTYGDRSPEMASALHNLAELASNSGEVRKAERLFRASFAIRTRIKAKPQSLYSSRSLLGVALRRQGRYDEAEDLLLQNQKLVTELYPDASGKRADLAQRLASLYRDKGSLVQAQAGYEEAIAIQTRISGPRSIETAILMGWLADVLESRGNLDQAERTLRSSEDILLTSEYVRELSKLRATASHQAFLIRHGRDGARDRLESALTRWIGHYEPNQRKTPWDLADARFLQAESHMGAGRLAEAEAALPPFDPELEQPVQQAKRHYYLSRLHTLRDDRDAAIAAIDHAIELIDARAGDDSATSALWRLDHADLLLASGKTMQARQQLALAEPVLKKQMVAEAPALERLQALKRAAGVG